MNLMMLTPTESAQALAPPLFLEMVPCGFPSPAQDYVEKELDLNEYCIRHRSATYYLRAHGDSMRDGFLFNGDLQPVQELWGVGSRIARTLNTMGITTALQLARTNPAFIRKNFSVVLERTVRELNGESCIPLEEAPPAKQQIVCSRSFGERIVTLEDMRQAVCQYAERAAEKLRGERQYSAGTSLFSSRPRPIPLQSPITVTWRLKSFSPLLRTPAISLRPPCAGWSVSGAMATGMPKPASC